MRNKVKKWHKRFFLGISQDLQTENNFSYTVSHLSYLDGNFTFLSVTILFIFIIDSKRKIKSTLCITVIF